LAIGRKQFSKQHSAYEIIFALGKWHEAQPVFLASKKTEINPCCLIEEHDKSGWPCTQRKKAMMPQMLGTNRLVGKEVGDFYRGHWGKKYSEWQGNSVKFDKGLRDRCVAKYLRDIEKYAPYWLDEFAGIDCSFGWHENTFASLELFGDATPPTPHECTSWILWPDLTGGQSVVLHKCRDSNVRELGVTLRHIPGYNKWLGLGNLGRLSPCMGINDKGLALAMNSGESTRENENAGLTTPDIARVLLEQCSSAEEALDMYRRIISTHSYAHGANGTIFFLMDRHDGIVIENTAWRMASGKLDYGFLIRSNSWHLPGIEAYSCASYKYTHGCEYREVQVRSALKDAFAAHGRIGLEDSWAISRCREGGWQDEYRAVCTMFTNSCSTFQIDLEYPEALATAFVAAGPPCHTVYLPMPIVIDEIPESMMNGSWAAAAFARQTESKMEADIQPFVDLEKQIMELYGNACAIAKGLLNNCEKQAAINILRGAFRDIVKIAEPLCCNITE